MNRSRVTESVRALRFAFVAVLLSTALPLGIPEMVQARIPTVGPCSTNDGKPCVLAGQKCAKRGAEQGQSSRVGTASRIRTFTCVSRKGTLRWRELDTAYVLTWSFDDFDFRYITDGYPLSLHGVHCSIRVSPVPIRYTTPGFAELTLGLSCGATLKNLSDVYELPYTPDFGYGIFLMRDLGVNQYGQRLSTYEELYMKCIHSCRGIAAGRNAQFGDSYWRSISISGTRAAIEGLYGDLAHTSRREGLSNVMFQVFLDNGGLVPEYCFVLGAETSISKIRDARLQQYGDANSCLPPESVFVW